MNQAQNPETDVEQIATMPKTPASLRRRRLLAGTVATPLLMTITSRPVWAGGGVCTPTALASANLSGQHDEVGCGISAGWWKNNTSRWPVEASPNDPFHPLFAYVMYNGEILYKDMTLLQVISSTGGGNARSSSNGGGSTNPHNLGLHLVGAYLNALTFPKQNGGMGYAYTDQEIINAFNSLHNAGSGQFSDLKSTLEIANNAYDASTHKP